MKKSILTLLTLALFTMCATAQNKDCKYEIDEVDKFTKQKLLKTRWERLSPFISSVELQASGYEVDSTKFLRFELTVQSARNVYVPKDGKLMILMGDGSTLTLIATEDWKGKVFDNRPNARGEVTQYTKIFVNYPLANDDLKKLQGPTTSLRLYFINGDDRESHIDIDFGKKRMDILSSMMKCF